MRKCNALVTLSFLAVFFLSTSLNADYCAKDEEGEAVGCSILVNSGDPMKPTLAFVAKESDGSREWELGVRILANDWVQLNGLSEIEVDGVEYEPPALRVSRRAQVKQGLVSESAYFSISEELVEAIANADEQVLLKVSVEESDPIEISMGADKFVDLEGLLAEAREKL